MGQQDAFEEVELLHSSEAVDDRLEAEFPASLRKADAILASQMEHYSVDLVEDDEFLKYYIFGIFRDEFFSKFSKNCILGIIKESFFVFPRVAHELH